jgi:UDP-N-acetylmuramate dehydrogenase
VQPSRDVPLADKTTLGVGGPASLYVRVEDEAALCGALAWASEHRIETRVLGGGSNLVVSDAGVDELVMEMAIRGVSISGDGERVLVTAAAGEPWDPLVERAVAENLAGIECLSGIPGRVGATPIQNVGAYGQEVSETIAAVRAWDRERKEFVSLSPDACRFGYRDSMFKSVEAQRFVVVSVTYALRRGGVPALRYPELARHLSARGLVQPTLADVRAAVLEVRRSKSMVIDPSDENRRSCGSFFVNPIVFAEQAAEVERRADGAGMPKFPQGDGRVKLSAAWLIERSGLARGTRQGAVGLSTRHTLALVCHEGARASDVVAFARRVRARVEERFGVRLVPEPQFWGFSSGDGLPDERLA